MKTHSFVLLVIYGLLCGTTGYFQGRIALRRQFSEVTVGTVVVTNSLVVTNAEEATEPLPPHLRLASDGQHYRIESRWDDGTWHKLIFGGPFDTREEAMKTIKIQMKVERALAEDAKRVYKPIP